MQLTILAVPDCPNASVLGDRLAAVLDGRDGVLVTYQVISDEGEAARCQTASCRGISMTKSP